ncbi:MAG TPA: HD domain-containing phosphohydrolase [Burkholderiales bacterium]|nr:HD domain-containing phosphohydrolase [Burkholderiales bacterium]
MDSNSGTIPDLFQRLDELNEVGIALSRERDLPRLLDLILLAAKKLTASDGGTLYRMTEDRRLRFEIFRNDTLGIAMGGATGQEIPFGAIDLFDKNGMPVNSMVAAYAVHHQRSISIADAYTESGFDFSGTKEFDRRTGYRSQSFLTVPMRNHEDDVIGVLQLINCKDRESGAVIRFSEADRRLVESLASQAAIALTNRLLIDHLENLFESFVTMMNSAIDDKSHHTGAHCQRVPLLTMMIADAVAACGVGPLKTFSMTEKDRYALKIAGLLHDCGKITTPVHVVDKATKLQTIYDRIDLIDTRFEVVRRDFELAAARGERESIDGALADLDADRAFLRQTNVGAEAMTDADVARVRDIARKYHWRDPDGRVVPFLSGDEIANLTVRHGTLTEEERRIINHHVDVTIQMLEAMPWPKHLANVAPFAAAHHERVDGKGYPRGLKRDEMPLLARCMAIADIFEALTAGDRPYKKGKTLNEALAILGQLKMNGHIDPDIFDVFMWQRVYERYAMEFLPLEQRGEVRLGSVPGYVPPPLA